MLDKLALLGFGPGGWGPLLLQGAFWGAYVVYVVTRAN